MRINNIPIIAFWPIGIAVLVALFVIYRRYRQRKKSHLEQSSGNPADTSTLTTVTQPPPATPPAPPGALVTLQVLPNRDKLLTIAKDRAKTGQCLYCDEPATAHRPTFVQRKPPGEEVYTFLGGTTRDVWQVQRERLSPVFAEAQEYQQFLVVCRTCADLETALYRDFLAVRNAEYSSFALEQRAAFHEFATYTAFEEMYRKLRAMRMKKDNSGSPPTQGTT